MQAKIFLSSFLATLLSVGVIATPTGVGPRGLAVIGGAVDTIETLVESTISGVDVILDNIDNALTPGEGDVPLVSTGVEARDLVSSKLSSINWARRIVANFHNRRVLQREPLDVFT